MGKPAVHENFTEYVVANLDTAIQKGWIKVYFQPVVRALTEQLCGMESLARWDDPEYGLIYPDQFVKALEDSKLIHKLDSYIVEEVCRVLHNLLLKELPVVPVSINFSRLDFLMCDMLSAVETAVAKYDIPRDYIHIEITESMFIFDDTLIQDTLAGFHNAGYEIWMDDFGSGYSSLNLLKDFDFDMLKLDMDFMRNISEKSKAIVRSTISMAKEIGVKTLSEGVETKEQLDFLKEVGCEMIQGFYYGRPEPILSMLGHLTDKGITVEKRKWRHFYDVAGAHVRDTDKPLSIIEDDGTNYKTLFMNRAFREQINFGVDVSLSEIDRRIYHTGSPLLPRYREFSEIIKRTGNRETFYYTDNGNYLRMEAVVLTINDEKCIAEVSIMNVTNKDTTSEAKRFDAKLRELNLAFEVIHLINIKNNDIKPLFGRFRYVDSEGYIYDDLEATINYFLKECVHPIEREKYREYIRLSNLKKRVEEGKRGYIEKVFRIKEVGGKYRWKDVLIMMIPGTEGNEFLCCFKDLSSEIANSLNENRGYENSTEDFPESNTIRKNDEESENGVTFKDLCDNMIWNSHHKFFWKDKDRRFLGVSQSFLDFYGIESLDEILGKTDEEMHWHVEDETYMDDELDIINKGSRVSDVKGQCIVRGVVHDIACSKMPIYKNNEIIGLIGSFVDTDEELARLRNMSAPSHLDSITKLMNGRSLIQTLMDYSEQYNDKQRDFGLIILKNDKYTRIISSYNDDMGEKFLAQMGHAIIHVTGQTCAVARIKESYFAILTYTKSRVELIELAEKIKAEVENIKAVDGNGVTVRVSYAARMRSENGISDENMYRTVMEDISNVQ